jgi:multisubunit Na+/H+ antiporter MnhB subunit
MANDLQTRPEASVASLVGGIVQDAQDLLKQQLNLFSSELRQDVSNAKDAAIALLAGSVVCLIGALLLALTAAKLLFWLFPQYLAEWGCYGIVGVVFVAIGAALLARSRQALNDVTVDQSVTGLKENVEWKTNPK